MRWNARAIVIAIAIVVFTLAAAYLTAKADAAEPRMSKAQFAPHGGIRLGFGDFHVY